MSYVVRVVKDIDGVSRGQEGEPVKRDGVRMYRFTTENGYALYSWKHIKENKDMFDVSQS